MTNRASGSRRPQSDISGLVNALAALAQTTYVDSSIANERSAAATLTNKTLTSPAVTSAGVKINGTTSGVTTLVAAAVASTTTVTLPGFTDTLVGRNTTDTLTAKTLTSPVITNPSINSLSSNTTATSAGTLAMSNTSGVIQIFTGTTTHTVTLPSASTSTGKQYILTNLSTGTVTVNSSNSALVATMPSGSSIVVTSLQAVPTTPAHWSTMLTLAPASVASLTSPAFTGAPTVNALPVQTLTTTTVSTSITAGVVANNHYVLLIASGGALTLPTAVGNSCLYSVKNMSGSALTIGTTSSQNIEGAAPTAMASNASWTLVSDQTGWRII